MTQSPTGMSRWKSRELTALRVHGVDLIVCLYRSYAADIAAHLEEYSDSLHKSVGWGGFTIFGGPDENGEARYHQ